MSLPLLYLMNKILSINLIQINRKGCIYFRQVTHKQIWILVYLTKSFNYHLSLIAHKTYYSLMRNIVNLTVRFNNYFKVIHFFFFYFQLKFYLYKQLMFVNIYARMSLAIKWEISLRKKKQLKLNWKFPLLGRIN